MQSRTVASIVLVAFAAAAIALAQREKSTGPAKPQGGKGGAGAGQTQEMQEAMKTGPEHAKLAKLAGTWDVATTMEGAGMPPNTTKETSTITSELGGRFVHERSRG